MGEVLHHPVFGRHRKDVATGVEERTFGGWRDVEAVNVVLHIFKISHQVRIVEIQADGNLFGTAGSNIQLVEVTPVFIYHLSVFAGRPHHVKILVESELRGLFGGCVVAVKVQPQVAVGDKNNVVAPPGGPLIGTGEAGNLFGDIIFQVIGP